MIVVALESVEVKKGLKLFIEVFSNNSLFCAIGQKASV